MKLKKVKIARLTDEQSKSINGGGTNNSTRRNFTCCWCGSGPDTFECATINPNDPNCNNTKPSPLTLGNG
jgi:hypothetical protein